MHRDLYINTPSHIYRLFLIVQKPDDGHYRPKHVDSLLEYNIFLISCVV